MDDYTQLSIGAVVALLLLREVFGFLRDKSVRSAQPSACSQHVEMALTEIKLAIEALNVRFSDLSQQMRRNGRE